jgi:hypothetical protein
MASLLTNFWFIQSIGVVALIFVFFAWNAKNRKTLLQLQAVNVALFIIQYALLHAYTGAIVQCITLARNIVFSKKGEKKWASSPLWTYFFMALSIVGLIIFWQGWVSLLPVVGVIVGTYGMSKDRPSDMRFYILLTTLVWTPYNLLVHSYSGFIGEVVSDIGVLVGMYRLDRKKK